MSALLDARERAGMSRSELAAKSGVGRESIRLYEVDGSEPRIDKAQRLARALGTTVDALWPADGPSEGGAR